MRKDDACRHRQLWVLYWLLLNFLSYWSLFIPKVYTSKMTLPLYVESSTERTGEFTSALVTLFHTSFAKQHQSSSIKSLNNYSPFPFQNSSCPPCFNCHLSDFPCLNWGNCSASSGQCACPAGFGGLDCGVPLCDSLATPDRHPRAPDQPTCACSPGWTGINCNVCVSDEACLAMFPISSSGGGNNATCWKSALPVSAHYSQCQVTNKPIQDSLKERTPEITFGCNRPDQSCSLQFWAGQKESFFCQMTACNFGSEALLNPSRNHSKIECQNMHCKCYPNGVLCEESGLNLSDWFLDPDEGPSGPATFECDETFVDSSSTVTRSCQLKESHINSIITQFFGDPFITLDCPYNGECLPQALSSDDGNTVAFPPISISAPWYFYAIGGIISTLFLSIAIYFFYKEDRQILNVYRPLPPRPRPDEEGGTTEIDSLLHGSTHSPCSLAFSGICYSATPRGGESLQILNMIQGSVKAGQCMAIMGGSGAGKSTFLDILAKRNKSGSISGDIFVNGKPISSAEYADIIGFVDQEDTLLDTLTVYETILYSALLRLPPDMPHEEKLLRVQETMTELGILEIANRRIGGSGKRGISGGEKRRVSIACELVTWPSILFLDEPTSGLDSFNAYNVVDSLVSMARNYQRTIVFTIHQPRSNIYALFDQLVLLAKGELVYSGPAQDAAICHFNQLGFHCPLGFSIADYLVDLSMHAVEQALELDEDEPPALEDRLLASRKQPGSPIFHGLESSTGSGRLSPHPEKSDIQLEQERKYFSPHFDSVTSGGSSSNLVSSEYSSDPTALKKADASSSQAGGPIFSKSNSVLLNMEGYENHLNYLVGGYLKSTECQRIEAEICECQANALPSTPRMRRVNSFTDAIEGLNQIHSRFLPFYQGTGKRRASWFTQFTILSNRTLKNIYRNPSLLLAHYIISVAISALVSILFYQLDLSLSGFQNRMGLMFFLLSVFGFSSLSSMQVFAHERLLFMKERASLYYSPFMYFLSKILFDIIPLRVIPPILLSLLSYHFVGLRSDSGEYLFRFTLVLVSFNVAAASTCLGISILFQNASLASLIATLVMLFEMLFSGLLLNGGGGSSATSSWFAWCNRASFFHYAFEALVVNEVRGLMLRENKYGLNIDVPGAVILQSLGLDALAYWPDVVLLLGTIGVVLVGSFVWLLVFVREKR